MIIAQFVRAEAFPRAADVGYGESANGAGTSSKVVC